MSDASNHFSIYLIVICNALCQIMLIWRLKLDQGDRLKYCALSVAIPLAVMVLMRIVVALGMVHGRVAEQGVLERALTTSASLLLLAGPVIATAAAIVRHRKLKELAVS